MKIIAIISFTLCVLGSWCTMAGQTPEKFQTIKIVPDPAFGQGVAWDSIFKKERDKYPAFLPDGSFFLGSSQEGKIYKFDPSGRIVVFENGFAQKSHDVSFRLYAQDGKLLSVNKIDTGEFEPVQPLRFQSGYAYSWLEKKDGDGSFVFGRWKIEN